MGEHKIWTRPTPEIAESHAGSHVGLKRVYGEKERKIGYVRVCTVTPDFYKSKTV